MPHTPPPLGKKFLDPRIGKLLYLLDLCIWSFKSFLHIMFTVGQTFQILLLFEKISTVLLKSKEMG